MPTSHPVGVALHALASLAVTQAQLAAWMGVHRSTVKKWLASERQMDLNSLARMRRGIIDAREQLCAALTALDVALEDLGRRVDPPSSVGDRASPRKPRSAKRA
jgi:hypothetical protein